MKNIHILPTDKARLYIHQGKLYDHKKTMHIADGTQIPQQITITSGNGDRVSEEGIHHIAGSWVFDIINNKVYKTCVNIISGEDIKKIILTTDQDLIKDGVQAIDAEFLEWFVKNPTCEEVEVQERQQFEPDKTKRENPLNGVYYSYKLIIPKEEPKQETTLKELLLQLRNTPMTFVPKKEQKQHLIDMMRGDEELGLYEEPKKETTLEEVAESEAFEFKVDYKPFETELDYREYAEFGFKKGFTAGAKYQSKRMYSKEEVLAYGKKCFYKGFEKAEKDDANCYTAFREEMEDLSRCFEQFKNK